MNRYALALALLLAPSIAAADSPPFAYDPSQTLSVVWDDATKTDLVEGSSTQVGNYKATDAELVTDGLTAGVRHGRVYAGVAAASVAPATDTCVGTIGPIYFSGSVVQTEAQYLLATTTSDTGSTTVGRAIHNLRQYFGSSTAGVAATAALVNAPNGGASTPVSPDVISTARTWVANNYRARNIVEVEDGFIGTLALKPDLNTATTISTVSEVSITGAATVTATDLSVDRSRLMAHFTVPALSTVGTYTVKVTVTTVDGQTILTTATLKVY